MRNKSISSFLTILLLCICFTVFTYQASAQDQEILELIDHDTPKQNISKQNFKNQKNNNRKEFYNLYKKLHSTFYFKNKKIKSKYGHGSPLKLTLEDASSIDKLKEVNPNYRNVKLITVVLRKESDLNAYLDLNNNRFPNLKYIYIKCLFNSNAKKIKSFIKKPKNVRVFYAFQKAS